MKKEIRKWVVEYSHKDGRAGIVEATTIITESGAFKYGNGKAGLLIINDYKQGYDLRYNNEKDLHRVMLKLYFGNGLVKASLTDKSLKA